MTTALVGMFRVGSGHARYARHTSAPLAGSIYVHVHMDSGALGYFASGFTRQVCDIGIEAHQQRIMASLNVCRVC